jgi:hypothetical protein
MPRGQASPVGTITVNANGYSQTKTEEGWVGTHILILEKKIGRKLKPGESARFKDNNRRNLNPDNIYLAEHTSTKSIQAKIAKLTAEIEDRQAMIKDLEKELSARALTTE